MGFLMGQGLRLGGSSQKRKANISTLIKETSTDVKFSKAADTNGFNNEIIKTEDSLYLSSVTLRTSKALEFLIRAFDIAGSLLLLILSLPLMFVVAVLIKIFSPGPILYKQERVGKEGKVFTLYKFRTMVNNAEEHIGPVLASKDDSRVTSTGRILRRTRLDELPQLFNVLQGDMSLVGPRPERPFFVNQHRVLQGIRLSVKPGITGLAQIRSYYDLKPNHKIKYDYLYIQKRSLLLNAYILLQTIPVIFTKKGW
jgi:lipopolysaccharide/colanic/teichoic acid biosynthesis glycosyltransferase